MSTSGMGVSWLHIRLDFRPKYYNWKPYTCSAPQLFESLQLKHVNDPQQSDASHHSIVGVSDVLLQPLASDSHDSQSSGPHVVEIPPVLSVSLPSDSKESRGKNEDGVSSEVGECDNPSVSNDCWIRCV